MMTSVDCRVEESQRRRSVPAQHAVDHRMNATIIKRTMHRYRSRIKRLKWPYFLIGVFDE